MKKSLTISTLLLFSYIVVIIIVLYVNYSFKLNDTSITNNNIIEFNEKWFHLDNGEMIVFPIPTKLQNNKTTIMSNKIPNIFTEDIVLCIRTSHQTLQVYIDNKLVYTYTLENNKVTFGKFFGKVWNFVNIPKESQGKDIKLVIDSSYGNSEKWIYPMTIGTRSATVLSLIKENIRGIIFCFLIFLLGIILIIFVVIIKLKHIDFAYHSLLYLSIIMA